jgi:excisionase family DNA binding protein
MEKYFTVKEIAEMFDINPQTVYNWIRTNKLESIKVGGNVRIKQEQLDTFITIKKWSDK